MYPLLLSEFNETWVFSTDFRKKKAQILNFIKIPSVGAGFFHEDGQTDMTDTQYDEANSRFSQFCKRS